jgi:L-threonylcarbamoyladenylate synthase
MAILINDIAQAAFLIQNGQPVAFPTETVYGLGADASNFDACAQIYKLKGRPAFNPLIVHVSCLEQAEEIGDFSSGALSAATRFWPGPLSLVVKLKKSALIASNVTANLPTIAIRMPSNKTALDLIRFSGKAIAAPSANISNYISATSAEHVMNDFADKDLHVLYCDDYQNLGLESTIVDFSLDRPVILRHGIILAEDLNLSDNCIEQGHVKSPGMLLKHYAPRCRLYLDAENSALDSVAIDFGGKLDSVFTLSKTGDLHEAAMNLYAVLRQADLYAMKNNYNKIIVASVPKIGLGVAINDKLNRAAK